MAVHLVDWMDASMAETKAAQTDAWSVVDWVVHWAELMAVDLVVDLDAWWVDVKAASRDVWGRYHE